MKKNLLILIPLIFALVLCVTVFAASGDAAVGSGSGEADNNSLTLSVEIPTSYEFKIPADAALEFGAEYTELGTVSVSNVRLPADTELCISYKGGASLKTEDGTSEIPYEIRIGDHETAGNLFFTTDGESAVLYVAIDKEAWDAAPAGSYSDTITFTASLSENTR